MGGNRCGVEPGQPALDLARRDRRHAGICALPGLQAYHGSAQHLRGWDERQQAIAGAVEKAAATRDLLRANGIACDNITGAGTGTFEFEAGSGVYTELQCGSYIFMDADYGRNLDRGGRRSDAFEHALFVWATVMSRPNDERAIVDAGLKALAFDSGPPTVWDEPAATYERASDEHGRLALGGATNRRGSATRCGSCPATATRPSICTTGTSASAATGSKACGRSRRVARFYSTEAERRDAVWGIRRGVLRAEHRAFERRPRDQHASRRRVAVIVRQPGRRARRCALRDRQRVRRFSPLTSKRWVAGNPFSEPADRNPIWSRA